MRTIGAFVFALLSTAAVAADPPWAIQDAPVRAGFRAGNAPTMPEAGWLLEVPELGVTSANMADVVLMDAKGAQLPLAKMARMEGHKLLLLAQNLTKGQEVFVYYGGNRQRREVKWSPKTSLLMETRRMPVGTKMDDWAQLDSAWKNAKESDGAGFVGNIGHGENPFGDSSNFLTHYSGVLRLPDKKATVYTISSDASFILANDKLVFGWPGKHNSQVNANTVQKANVSAPEGVVKIDYFHGKEAGGNPTMLLGWEKGGKLEAIPADAWVHPGTSELVRIEHVAGWPVPQANARVATYIGYEGHWLFETQCSLKGGLPAGWSARWEWNDGAIFEGAECNRVCVGPAPARVIVRLANGQQQTSGARQVEFNGTPPAASIENDGDVKRYMGLIEKEDPARLAAPTLAGHLTLVGEFGTDQLLGRYGTAWVAKNNNQSDPLWLTAQLARIRSLAQTNPPAAVAELHKFDLATRKKFPQLSMLELDILVFGLKSPEALPIAQRVAFDQPNTDYARIAKVRVGDLYRLLGKVKEARAQYESVQKTIADETGGKKLPAMDRAFSITITGLIDQGERKAAEAKLAEWEADHPLAKYESDFLLLRGRVLMLFGRWNEALQEIESFRTFQGDNPFQILADFYRAKALFELGKKDEAKKIWGEIAKNYPKHELAGEAGRLAR
jgi:tetratricopeptide (TPR) repeat protein